MEISYLEIAFRLALSMVLGGAVGFERESHRRPAGFRTHILVCMGSALVMMVSAYGFAGERVPGVGLADPSRIAAQVVTGVGFLGAGTILRHGNTVRGLTTAASLWIVSAIGLAVGIGFYLGGVAATLLVLLSLVLLRGLEGTFIRMKRLKRLWVKGNAQPGLLGQIGSAIGENYVFITKVDMSDAEFDDNYNREIVSIEFLLQVPYGVEKEELIRKLTALPGVLEVKWEGEDIVKGENNNSSQ